MRRNAGSKVGMNTGYVRKAGHGLLWIGCDDGRFKALGPAATSGAGLSLRS